MTAVVFESPYRLSKLLKEIPEYFGKETPVVIVREATKVHQEILRGTAAELEEKYGMEIVISADGSIKNIGDFKIDKTRVQKSKPEAVAAATAYPQEIADTYANSDEDETEEETAAANDETDEADNVQENTRRGRGHGRSGNYRRGRRSGNGRGRYSRGSGDNNAAAEEAKPSETPQPAAEDAKPEKKTWWKKLLG